MEPVTGGIGVAYGHPSTVRGVARVEKVGSSEV